jgi:virginiamycin A acetyltransferase
MIEIHPTAKVSPLADLEDSIKGIRIEIGEDSRIDAFVKIKPAGGTGDLIIGKAVYTNSGCVMYTGNGIRIGNNVVIAANCTLAPVNHAFTAKDMPIVLQEFLPSRGGIIIEDDVWVGANCVIPDGAIIRHGSVIGAASIVRSELKLYGIHAGNPLKQLGQRQ